MADTTKNKVTYGLKNVHVWPITAVADDGKPTYGTIINMPGATEMSMDPEGSTDPFFADDIVWFNGTTNSGYSGSFTFADVPDEFRLQVLKETKDASGAIFESADAVMAEFAIAFEFKGDARHRRHIFYRCSAERPSISSKTKEDKIDPNTPEINVTALPRLDNALVKASCEESDSCYDKWFGATPYEKTETTTG